MRKIIAACLLAWLLIPPLTIAAKKWEKKPYTQWSLFEVSEILRDSPWATPSIPAPSAFGPASGYYQVRLLTAKPIEEALSRLGALESFEPTISVQEIQGTDAEKENARLQRYLASEKGQFMTELDRRYIIVSLSILAAKDIYNDDRLPARFADLHPPTTLTTDTGKQVRMVRFIPPDKHQLGALFYFSRNLHNGEPLLTAADNMLEFKATVKGSTLRVKFNPKKMDYKGVLEY